MVAKDNAATETPKSPIEPGPQRAQPTDGGPSSRPRPGADRPFKRPDNPTPIDAQEAPARPNLRPQQRGEKPSASQYPANLHLEGRIPHLIVLKMDAAGVTFAFDSVWLKHAGFRASMPLRCVFSGYAERSKLIARPLIFVDRSSADKPMLEQISARHENLAMGDRAPRQLMKLMGLIESMPRPFDHAMPHYVSTKHTHMPLHCRSRERSSGNITCEVLIPDLVTALDWLARVNGVCGKDYELLSYDVLMLHDAEWQNLPEQCRQRIAVWCKLDPHESLRAYFNDADFGRQDAGLAGLVVTDERVAYCKYHHRGEVRLDNGQATILVKRDARFANLTLLIGNNRSRMVKLHRQDLDQLKQHVSRPDGIKVVVTEGD